MNSLTNIFSADNILIDADSLQRYGRDWTRQYNVNASAVVFPETEEQVVRLVLWARKEKAALIPSGGRTGLSGGAVATRGEIVVSFERMNKILEFNPIDHTVRCEPGVITETLQKYVRDQGYYFPVDFAARGSSQIGGNIATNAGGVKVIRYGSMREWVAGVRVVTGRGDALDFNQGLTKNATGFDFRHLFIGSEGVLGFVTEATLKFTKPATATTVLILGVPTLDAIMKVFQKFRAALNLTAFEFFSDQALTHVLQHANLQAPFASRCPYYLLIEVENLGNDSESLLLECFESCVTDGWVTDGVVSQSEVQARDFWRLREDISEALSAHTPYKNDISVTIANVPALLNAADTVLRSNYPDFEVIWFGHIGDGNMHINILKPTALSTQEFYKRCQHVNDLLFNVIQKLGGSVSAEHGVGLVKKPFLQYTRAAAEIELMRGIKRVFDPDGILNPGKIFD